MIATDTEILTALGKLGTATDAEKSLLALVQPLAEAVMVDYLGGNPEYQSHTEYLPLGRSDIGSAADFPLDDLDIDVSSTRVTLQRSTPPGTSVLQLRHTPVWLTGLVIYEDPDAKAGQADSPFAAATLLTEGTDYFLDVDDATNNLSRTGHVHRYGGWPTEPRSVKVTYFGGNTAAQLNSTFGGAIKLAAILTTVKAFNQFKAFQSSISGPVTSESLGKYSRGFGLQLASVFAGGGFTIPYEAQQLLMRKRNYAGLFG